MTTIKEARQAAGLTQKAAAELLEVPKRTLENWEEGHRAPKPWIQRLIIKELLEIAAQKENDQVE